MPNVELSSAGVWSVACNARSLVVCAANVRSFVFVGLIVGGGGGGGGGRGLLITFLLPLPLAGAGELDEVGWGGGEGTYNLWNMLALYPSYPLCSPPPPPPPTM